MNSLGLDTTTVLATNDPQIWNGIRSLLQVSAVVKSVRVVNSAKIFKAKGTSSILALNGTPMTRATGRHQLYCTQVNMHQLNPSPQAGTQFTSPEGWKTELTRVAGYIPSWCT